MLVANGIIPQPVKKRPALLRIPDRDTRRHTIRQNLKRGCSTLEVPTLMISVAAGAQFSPRSRWIATASLIHSVSAK